MNEGGVSTPRKRLHFGVIRSSEAGLVPGKQGDELGHAKHFPGVILSCGYVCKSGFYYS